MESAKSSSGNGVLSSTPDIMETCKKMHKTIKKMEKALSSCIPVEAPITKVTKATKKKESAPPPTKKEEPKTTIAKRGRPTKTNLNEVFNLMEGGNSSYAIANGNIVQKAKRGRPPKKIVAIM